MALDIEDNPGILNRKTLLNQKLKDLNESAQNLNFQSATWSIYFIKRNLDITLSELAVPFFSTLTLVATLSCGISTGILVTEKRFTKCNSWCIWDNWLSNNGFTLCSFRKHNTTNIRP